MIGLRAQGHRALAGGGATLERYPNFDEQENYARESSCAIISKLGKTGLAKEETMQLIKLTPHIYYSEPEKKTDRPILGYIAGDRRAVMVDAGNSKAHYETYRNLLKEHQLRMPEMCVITHWHWDHTFGIHALEQKSYAHVNTNHKLREMSLWEWSDAAMKDRLRRGIEISFADMCMRAEYEDVTNIRVIPASEEIQSEMRIDCGGITCQCMHFPSAHSDDSIVVYVPEEKVVFIGDIYGDDLYHHGKRDLEETQALYLALKGLEFEIAIPGHSEPLSKERLLSFLRQFIPNE